MALIYFVFEVYVYDDKHDLGLCISWMYTGE